MLHEETELQIGALLFEGLDQIDLTGPFEVLSRLPNSTYRIYGKDTGPVRDARGLRLTPDATLADAPQLDVLLVPGGPGQEDVMDDDVVLEWVRRQAQNARVVLSVCTGALICGAAGLLKNRRATTHWAAFHLLPYFGTIPVNQRVVTDGNMVIAAGVTAGIDGAWPLSYMATKSRKRFSLAFSTRRSRRLIAALRSVRRRWFLRLHGESSSPLPPTVPRLLAG